MDPTTDHTAPPGAAPAYPTDDDPYRPLRIGRRLLVGVLALFCALYYPILHLAAASAIPLAALAVVGTATGFVGRRKTLLLYGVLAWLVVAATVVRRVATAEYAPQLFIFDGALAGYPAWSVWLAEVLRVGANLWSLWLGARLGRALRFGLEARIRRLVGTAT